MFYIQTSPNVTPGSDNQVLLGYFGQYTITNTSADQFTLAQTDRAVVAALPVPSDKYINLALCYLFRKATLEVKQFNNKTTIAKHSVEYYGVLFRRFTL